MGSTNPKPRLEDWAVLLRGRQGGPSGSEKFDAACLYSPGPKSVLLAKLV